MAEKKLTPESLDNEKSFRDELFAELSQLEAEIGPREHAVMTRLSGEFIQILDALVKLDVFRSRSEAVASIVEMTILSRYDLFEQLKNQAEKQDELQGSAKSLVRKALKG